MGWYNSTLELRPNGWTVSIAPATGSREEIIVSAVDPCLVGIARKSASADQPLDRFTDTELVALMKNAYPEFEGQVIALVEPIVAGLPPEGRTLYYSIFTRDCIAGATGG